MALVGYLLFRPQVTENKRFAISHLSSTSNHCSHQFVNNPKVVPPPLYSFSFAVLFVFVVSHTPHISSMRNVRCVVLVATVCFVAPTTYRIFSVHKSVASLGRPKKPLFIASFHKNQVHTTRAMVPFSFNGAKYTQNKYTYKQTHTLICCRMYDLRWVYFIYLQANARPQAPQTIYIFIIQQTPNSNIYKLCITIIINRSILLT